ncbi:hypothetical protein OPT61_g1129 [Boeremia exigua]|uniref:Uncharacterized protein n=1 Tax=Boeremia exigua TaxID=749465 RepID=A0ACC2IRG8_9PLEO|nr:hypothetical protein OPT61_g1129 [Boeremia exigua]
MISNSNSRPNEPIAIIGTSFRFPGADTPTGLWDLLSDPRDTQCVIPPSRFAVESFYSPDGRKGTICTQHGYFLSEDHRNFDAEFFGIKPVEANSMDPQQRMLLEVIYEGIEAAGLSTKALRGSQTGVYVGLMAGDYSDMLNRNPSDFPSYAAAGTARSMISNRVSYFFDWRGPSMTIDTACSSSLVAVHQAVQSLRLGETQVAVAAGANLILGPEQFIAGSAMKMLSPDGRSYMWDTRANGYARGEGVAAVILKTLSAAIADGDDIECVIVETGVNQDGRTKGLTMPSAEAQTNLIQTTYKKAGLDLNKLSDRPQYFEAHGTGTPAGDPVEAQAIHDAFFGPETVKRGPIETPLYCGSVKTIIGHTEGTAGIAGLLKASLAVKHGVIPPNRLFDNLAPTVRPFYDNLEIVTQGIPWPNLTPSSARRASVNSFGFGGTNAHCIVESYCHVPNKGLTNTRSQMPFIFSAASEKSLASLLAAFSNHLRSDSGIDLQALSHTLCTRRTSHSFRVAFSAKSAQELCEKLDSSAQVSKARPKLDSLVRSSPIRILGIFTGQGAQWAGMARELMQFPAAVQIIADLENSLAELQDPPTWSLRAEMSANKTSSRVTEAAIAQPVCTAVQILLVEMLRAAGIRFTAVVGHSSGEIAAAFAANRLSARDAIRVAYYRGVHLPLVGGKDGEAGSMIAVAASYPEAQQLCDSDRFIGRVCVAACNSIASVTLSGDIVAIQEIEEIFHTQKRFARRLRVDNAYHSHHMIRCSEAITASLHACKITYQQPSVSDCLWISSVDLKPITKPIDIIDYWHRNTVGCVLFSQALDQALGLSEFDLAVEVGAHPALKGPALQMIESALGRTIPYTGMLCRNMDDTEAFTAGIGYIWTHAQENVVDYAGYHHFMDISGPVLKGLPSYAWDYSKTFWYESRISHEYRNRSVHHELLGSRSPDYSTDQIMWRNCLIPEELPWIREHCIQGQMVFPGSGYIVSAFEASLEAVAPKPVQLLELIDLEFGQPLVFTSEDTRVDVLITLSGIRRQKSNIIANFSYHSIANKGVGPMSLNACGQIRIVCNTDADILQNPSKRYFGMTEVDQERIYASLARFGYQYSGTFKALNSVKRKPGVASGMIQVPERSPTTSLLMHPATLDAAIHSIAVAHSYPGDGRMTSLLLPIGISKVSLHPVQAVKSAGDRDLTFTSFSKDNGDGDVDVYHADGSNVILRLEGLCTKPMVPATSKNDTHLFSETVWGPAFPTLANTIGDFTATRSCPETDLKIMIDVAKQIAHRYPAMNIITVGVPTADAVKNFLTELNHAFASLTYTDMVYEAVNSAKVVLSAFEDKLIYKILDTDTDITKQGFVEHSYDLVVALQNTPRTSNVDHMMKNIKQLLKPGGYFLSPQLAYMEELSQSSPPPDQDAETPSNLGRERPFIPAVEASSRAQLLERYDFADADWFMEPESSDLANSRVILLQALDHRIRVLRKPLVFVEPPLRFSEITLVGGATPATSACMSNLKQILQAYSTGVTQVNSLSDLSDANLSFGGNAVVLQDHDKPLFQDLEETTLKGLQKLFARSKDVLWVTQGYKHNFTHARMFVAFARCLLQEMPHIRLQILDLPSTQAHNAKTISEDLLRLLISGRLEQEGRFNNILWSVEPEISYDNGRSIPRVKVSKPRNDRYNARRRDITVNVDPNVSMVTVSAGQDAYVLRAKNESKMMHNWMATDVVTIRVTYSFLKAVRIGSSGYLFVLLGFDTANNEQVVALSSKLSSTVDVPRSLVRPCHLAQNRAVDHLRALFGGMIAYTALRDLSPNQSLLILEPREELAAIIAAFSEIQDVQAVFLTATPADYCTSDERVWKRVPSRASRRDISSVLRDLVLSRIVCLENNYRTNNMREELSDNIPIDSSGVYIASKGCSVSTEEAWKLSAVFDRVLSHLTKAATEIEFKTGNLVPLADVNGLNINCDVMTMVDWTPVSDVSMQLEPVERRTRFCSDKTYWLVGLTGDLGLSLSEWMITRNARYIVLSSRNPKIDHEWLAHFEGMGATVKVYGCDLTDRKSVQDTHNRIKANLPPIAGLCHGAMILRDTLIQDLDMAKVKDVLKPKVDGAIHLDLTFQDYNLDFFISLSSVAAVTGNPGQSVYAAANGFLAALTAQRRARGKSASCIALGAVLGCGYATRGLTLAQQKSLEKAGVMWTSVQDFHSAFAEAILLSPPYSNTDGEFATGVRVSYTDELHIPKHANNPIFSHLVLQRSIGNQEPRMEESETSARTQLLLAISPGSVLGILEDFLTSRLRKALQSSPDATIIDQTADTLGIDSLIAVEMKSWLMKELNVDMPLMVIIGGNTIRGVVVHCAKLLESSMTPLLQAEANTDQARVLDAAKLTGTRVSSHTQTPEAVSFPAVLHIKANGSPEATQSGNTLSVHYEHTEIAVEEGSISIASTKTENLWKSSRSPDTSTSEIAGTGDGKELSPPFTSDTEHLIHTSHTVIYDTVVLPEEHNKNGSFQLPKQEHAVITVRNVSNAAKQSRTSRFRKALLRYLRPA